jgi:hypothetical protein
MPNIQALLELIALNEICPEECFDMSFWECGTTHCLAGNYAVVHTELFYTEAPHRAIDLDRLAEHFDITRYEAEWLFTDSAAAVRPNGWLIYLTKPINLRSVTKEQAINRVRKFVYYKLHKAEMTLEEARHIDGNKAVTRTQQLLTSVA